MDIVLLALMWGGLSAISLPLGALAGLWLEPPRRVTSALMAFGGGALLFALSVELFAHSFHVAQEKHDPWIILSTMAGSVLGGIAFEGLNLLLNRQGGFLRKDSLLRRQILRLKRRQARRMVEALSRIKVLHSLPADELVLMIPLARPATFRDHEVVFHQGDAGDRLYFITCGQALVEREGPDGIETLAELDAEDTFGEMSLLTDEPRTATLRARGELHTLSISKRDFHELLKTTPALASACRELAAQRFQSLQERLSTDDLAPQWLDRALRKMADVSLHVTDADVQRAGQTHGGAALAIWLGMALDGIPESLVIGMLVALAAATGQPMSLAFVAGVFLANLPEAMSSAVTMRRQGTGIPRILWMWGSLCVMTGLGAMLGVWMIPVPAEGAVLYLVHLIEGLAAGAMLVMIAETMLPEAFEQGGSVVGLSTLAGFLAALGVKLVE